MELIGLHQRGELIDIRWPGGLYDFKIKFSWAEAVNAPGWDGWIVLHGFVVEPQGPKHQTNRSFYAKPIGESEYEMIPYSGVVPIGGTLRPDRDKLS